MIDTQELFSVFDREGRRRYGRRPVTGSGDARREGAPGIPGAPSAACLGFQPVQHATLKIWSGVLLLTLPPSTAPVSETWPGDRDGNRTVCRRVGVRASPPRGDNRVAGVLVFLGLSSTSSFWPPLWGKCSPRVMRSVPSGSHRGHCLGAAARMLGSIRHASASLYGNRPATVFQKPPPLIRSYWMVTDLVLLNRMVIRSYQLVVAFCRTWFAVIVTGSELYVQHGPVRK